MRLIARLNIGGPAIHVSLLSARLNPARFHTTLVYGTEAAGEGSMRDVAHLAHVETVYIPELGREISVVTDVMTLFKLMRLMRRLHPTIVHTHTAKAGWVGRVAARFTGVPIVIHTFHGHIFRGYFNPLVSSIFVSLERLAAALSDRILTVSPRLRDELIAYRIAPPDKIAVVPLGFDLEAFIAAPTRRGEFRAELGLPSDVPLIGIVGRLVPVKNHRLFLAAARLLQAAGVEAYFVVVGDGELRAALERQAESLGIAGRVIFTGWRRDLIPVYADLAALALTSVNEGTPVSVIEAMAAGCPVVATRVGGVPDVITDGVTGRLIDSGDASALARAIQSVLVDSTGTRATAEAARADVARRFQAATLVQNVEALYERLLKEKRLA